MTSSTFTSICSTVEDLLSEGNTTFASNLQLTVRLRKMLLDANSSLSDINNAISGDAILSARVLSVANSAAYGNRKHTSIKDAVATIGTSTLNYVVFSVIQKQLISKVENEYKVLLERLWRHSTEIARLTFSYSKVKAPVTSNRYNLLFLSMLIHLDLMFVLFAASKHRDILYAENFASAVKSARSKFRRKILGIYEIQPYILDTLNYAYVPYNLDTFPQTELEILSYSVQSIRPHDTIKNLLPKVLNYFVIEDLEVINFMESTRTSIQ